MHRCCAFSFALVWLFLLTFYFCEQAKQCGWSMWSTLANLVVKVIINTTVKLYPRTTTDQKFKLCIYVDYSNRLMHCVAYFTLDCSGNLQKKSLNLSNAHSLTITITSCMAELIVSLDLGTYFSVCEQICQSFGDDLGHLACLFPLTLWMEAMLLYLIHLAWWLLSIFVRFLSHWISTHFIFWITGAYHSKHCTGRYQDTREEGPGRPRVNWRSTVNRLTNNGVHLGKSRGGSSWQTRMASECGPMPVGCGMN